MSIAIELLRRKAKAVLTSRRCPGLSNLVPGILISREVASLPLLLDGNRGRSLHDRAHLAQNPYDFLGIPLAVWIVLGVLALLLIAALLLQVGRRGRQADHRVWRPGGWRRRRRDLPFAVGQRTDVGRKRSLNEDSLLSLQGLVSYGSAAVPVGVFAVADGIGGQQAGDVASKMTIETVAQHADQEIFGQKPKLDNPHDWVSRVIEAANAAVYDYRQGSGTNLGSTLVLALLIEDTASIGHAGDSRAYWLTPERIVPLTIDHSLVQRLVEAGQIAPEEARTHPRRNIIYRTIGDKDVESGDLVEQKLGFGEALLLCSDGLNSMLSDPQIWEIWAASSSAEEACDRLVEAANEAGGGDNITVIVIQRCS